LLRWGGGGGGGGGEIRGAEGDSKVRRRGGRKGIGWKKRSGTERLSEATPINKGEEVWPNVKTNPVPRRKKKFEGSWKVGHKRPGATRDRDRQNVPELRKEACLEKGLAPRTKMEKMGKLK